jgi:hypothetical protein
MMVASHRYPRVIAKHKKSASWGGFFVVIHAGFCSIFV